MQIRTRLCTSLDGYVTTPDGWPIQLADPGFVPGESYGFPEFQQSCDAALMGRTTFEPALGADRWPWPKLDVESAWRTWSSACLAQAGSRSSSRRLPGYGSP